MGANYYHDFVTGKQLRTGDGLTATLTKMGWVLSGKVNVEAMTTSSTSVATAHVLKIACEDPLKEQLERFWEIENCGVSKIEEFETMEFSKKIKFDGIRYCVALPWKQGDDIKLPNNFVQSKRRLMTLMKKLRGDEEMLIEYDRIIKQQEKEGIIERCTSMPPDGFVHYFPHFGAVKNDRETTKLRVVGDASSNNPSLNSRLEKGPCLLPLLVEVLIRFRVHKVAMISDIKQAYLNVGVMEKDRDFLRFLWWEEIQDEDLQLVIFRFTRLFFGMISAQFLLLLVIHLHLKKYENTDHKLILHILMSLYVDDYTGGAENAKEAYQQYQRIKQIFSEAGLDFRKWRTNDTRLQKRLDDNEGVNRPESNLDAKVKAKVLGVDWDVESDVIRANIREAYQKGRDLPATKRNILKSVASIYDPIGTLAPLVIRGKMFFQKLTEKKGGWDAELDAELKAEWRKVLEIFAKGKMGILDRYYFENFDVSELSSIVLHGFCDGSQDAYAAVVYIVGNVTGKGVVSKFVICK